MVRIALPPREQLTALCTRFWIRKLSLFGSVVRDDFGSDSDVDVIVEFEPEARIGFFELYDVEQALSELMGGRRVDLHTPAGLSPYIREAALAETIWVAA